MDDGVDVTELSDEFADYHGELVPFRAELAWSRLLNPPTLRGLAALVGGLVFLFSDQSTTALSLILAIVLVVWAVSEFSAPTAEGRVQRLTTALLLAGIGVALLVWPDVTGRIISRLLGGAIIFVGARDLYRAIRRDDDHVHVWGVIRGLFQVAVGIALWVAPATMLSLVITLFAGFWIITGIATAVGNFTGMAEDDVDVTDVWYRIFRWLEQRPHTADDRSQLYGKIFYEGAMAARRLSRFFLLMGFATTIAAFGIISDSTAVVIGAMLVAPLMTPLMGTSLSLTMGWPKRAAMSAGVALGGVALAIGLSAVYGGTLAWGIDPVTNSQVASRVAPTLIDLIIAIAAGGAGAFALSRPDVSDALPGVAVAIALVPPLAVVGLMLEARQFSEAFGALMLFTTNMVAILLVGALVFLLTGVVPVAKLVSERVWIRNTTTLIGILAIVVLVVLGSTSERIRAQSFDRDNVAEVVDSWIGDRSLNLVSYTVAPDQVELVLVGGDRPDDTEDLDAALDTELQRNVTTVVRWVPEERFVVNGD
ncbi:MAG: DUF389 domain-containing protein [Acidimicrobiia bacterium]|nr:DUF389 domain-containing protein [Acidimicrobiia bacterium]